MSRPQRIFIGLTEVAGYFGGLREGFERLGYQVEQVNESTDPYLYGGGSTHAPLGALSERLYRYELTTTGARGRLAMPVRRGLGAARLPSRLVALQRAMRSSDVFVFGNNSFVGTHDLRLIRRAGKRIVWIFLGSDHRPPYLNGKIVRERAGEPERLIAEARATRQRVQRIERYAHAVVAHGPSAQFHRHRFAEFVSVGAPVRTIGANGPVASVGPWPGSAGVRILHSPTDPAKGSDIIRASIERLRSNGLAISYLELVGVPNAEVRARMTQADLVIDEVFSDTPMGLFATEAATAGIPAIVGGYWASDVAAALPASSIPPSAFVPPENLQRTIERLVLNHDERQDLGRRARAFVENRWRPDLVAERVLALANSEEAEVIMREPAELTYCAGWGMPIEIQHKTVRAVLASGGRAGLGLGHNPALEARMIAGSISVEELPS